MVAIASSSWNNTFTVSENAVTPQIIDADVTLSFLSWAAGANTSLMVGIASANSGDQLTVKSTPPALFTETITVAGSNITYTSFLGTATVIGTIDATLNGASGQALKINLNASATTGMVQLLARNIQFANPTSDNPPVGARAITLTLDDNNAGVVTSSSATVTITAINDAPVIAGDLTATVAEGATYQVTTADLGEADPDDAGTGLTYTVTSQTNGTVKLNGSAATQFTAQDVIDNKVSFTHDGSEANNASFGFTLADGGEDGALAASGTFNLTVTPVNDDPTTSPVTLAAIAEDSGARTITQAELLANAGDIDGGTLSATGLAIATGSGNCREQINCPGL